MRSICAARSTGSSARWSSSVAHGLLAPRPLGGDDRRVEAGVAHAPGQAAHHRMPQLGGAHEVVEHPLVALPHVRGQRVGAAQPPAQQVEDHGHVRGRPPVRDEHPVQRRGQLIGLLEVGHPVMGERPAQLGAERLGQGPRRRRRGSAGRRRGTPAGCAPPRRPGRSAGSRPRVRAGCARARRGRRRSGTSRARLRARSGRRAGGPGRAAFSAASNGRASRSSMS